MTSAEMNALIAVPMRVVRDGVRLTGYLTSIHGDNMMRFEPFGASGFGFMVDPRDCVRVPDADMCECCGRPSRVSAERVKS